MKVSKSAIIQYMAIYFMLILNQSNLYRYYLRPYRMVLLVVVAMFFFSYRISRRDANFFFLLFLLGSVTFVRFWSGGTGLETYADYAIPIMATIYAIKVDTQKFVYRFLRVCVFICYCSIAGTLISFFAPQLIRTIGLPFTTGSGISTWTSATDYTTNYFKGYGLFLYSWIDRSSYQRNIGIFTEPGVFQMVINISIFLLLFMKKWISTISDRCWNRYMIVFILALVTCQSTTGYMGAAVTFLGALWSSNEITLRLKRKTTLVVVGAIAALLIDYLVRGVDSVISIVLLNKLIDADGAFSFAASSSGKARLGTMEVCLQSMLKYPLGLGTVKAGSMILAVNDANVAGALLAFGATLGIIPFLVAMVWMFRPIIKSNLTAISKWVYVFLYLNTALAQSSAFYPALIVIPILIRSVRVQPFRFDNRTLENNRRSSHAV